MAQKILFVDDERDLVHCSKLILEEAGYDVVGAYDGLQALQLVEQEKPDLIVLDVAMPQLSGWDVLQQLQLNPDTANIPVLMLTAKAEDESKSRGWELGCTFYQTKPFEYEDLLMVIERILASTSS